MYIPCNIQILVLIRLVSIEFYEYIGYPFYCFFLTP